MAPAPVPTYTAAVGVQDYTLGGTVSIRGAAGAVRALGLVGAASKATVRGLVRVARSAGRTVFGAFRRLGGAAAGLAAKLGIAGLAGTVVGAVAAWSSFETQIAKVGTLLGGGTTEAMERFGKSVQRFSLDTGQSTEKVSEGLFQALSAGVEVGKANKFLGVAAKAAVAGFTDINVAVDGLTNVLNAYGLSADKATDISDAFFVANKLGKTTLREISAEIGNAAPLAAELGAGYQDILAALVSITKAGVKTNQAFTQISAIMAALTGATADQVKVAKKLGLAFGPGAIKHYGGFVTFLQAVQEKSGGSIATLRKLFPSIEALRGVVRLTGSGGMREMAAAMKDFRDESGITERKFQDVSKTIGFQLAQLKQTMVAVFRVAGKGLVEGLGLDFTGLSARIQGSLPGIEASVKAFFGGVRAGVQATWRPTWEEVKSAFGVVSRESDTALRAMTGGFRSTSSSAHSWGESVGRTLTGLARRMATFAKNLEGVAGKIRTVLTTASQAAKAIGTLFGMTENDADKSAKGKGLTGVSENDLRKRALSRLGLSLGYRAGHVPKDVMHRVLSGTHPNQDLYRKYVEDERRKALGPGPASGLLRSDVKRSPSSLSLGPLRTMGSDPKLLGTTIDEARKAKMPPPGLSGPDIVRNNWKLNVKVDQKFDFGPGSGSSASTRHSERGAGDAVVELRQRQKYLITEGRITSVPEEFVDVAVGRGAIFAGAP